MFFGEKFYLILCFFLLTQTRPIREKFQGVPGRLARYSLAFSVIFSLFYIAWAMK